MGNDGRESGAESSAGKSGLQQAQAQNEVVVQFGSLCSVCRAYGRSRPVCIQTRDWWLQSIPRHQPLQKRDGHSDSSLCRLGQ